MKLTDLWKTKHAKILITANLLYFALLIFVKKISYPTTEIMYSLLFYLVFAIIISKVYYEKNMNAKKYFVLGAVSVFLYAIIMPILFEGALNVNWLVALVSAAQQGFLTGVVAFLWGVSYD